VNALDAVGAVLEIRDLLIHAGTRRGPLTLVDGVSFNVPRGEITALVGESGCGKSITSLSVMGLLPPRVRIAGGTIRLAGRPVENLAESDYLAIRGRVVSMIFQEPMTSLNPLHTVGNQVAEVYRIHFGDSRRTALEKAVKMLDRVRIPDPSKRAAQYPHQMSGGMRQRVMIAMSLAAEPELLLADEPTTALDVTIQAQILDLLRELAADTARKTRTGILLITHDMGVVAETASNVIVMYAGKEVESGPVREIFARPAHPYTKGLLEAIPDIARRGERLKAIPGLVPRPGERPAGCAFAPRCGLVMPKCLETPVPLFARGRPDAAVRARCFLESIR
jgi:peptide/nickel transport system ATP-binding protein